MFGLSHNSSVLNCFSVGLLVDFITSAQLGNTSFQNKFGIFLIISKVKSNPLFHKSDISISIAVS